MKKKFVTNLVLLVFLNLLIKPFWIFGVDRSVQALVGAEAYGGSYFALFNLSLILNIILDLGLTNFNNRNISQHSYLFNKYFPNLVVLKLLLAVIYFFIIFVVSFCFHYEWGQIKMLLFLAFNQFLLSFILFLRSNLSGLHFFKTDSLVSVLDRALMILICGAMLWGHIFGQTFKIEWFVYSQTIAYLMTALFTFYIVYSKLDSFVFKFNHKFLRVILRKSYPFAILVLLMGVYNRIDGVMLERLLPTAFDAGIYANAFRILDAVSMFALLFSGLLLPMFARMIKLKEPVEQLVRLAFLLVIIPALSLAVSTSLFSKELMGLMYKEHVEYSAQIFQWLILGFVPISTTYIFGTLLTANGSLKQLNTMASAGMVLNLVLNFILIPRYKALGAAFASITTQTVTAIAQMLITKKIFRFNIKYSFYARLVAYILCVYGTGAVVKSFLHVHVHWVIVMGGLFCANIIFAFAINLLSIKGLYQIMKHDS